MKIQWNEVIRVVPGCKSRILVVERGGKLELWDETAEYFYGSVPISTTPSQIDLIYEFYRRGFCAGSRGVIKITIAGTCQ